MRNVTYAVLVPALAVTCLAGLTEPAAAQQVDSRVVITSAMSDTQHFMISGKVASGDNHCKKKRRIAVYHDTDPAGPDPNDYLIGTVKSDRKGHWDLTSVALPDKVYVVMKKKGDCSGDTSPTEDVELHSMG